MQGSSVKGRKPKERGFLSNVLYHNAADSRGPYNALCKRQTRSPFVLKPVGCWTRTRVCLISALRYAAIIDVNYVMFNIRG